MSTPCFTRSIVTYTLIKFKTLKTINYVVAHAVTHTHTHMHARAQAHMTVARGEGG